MPLWLNISNGPISPKTTPWLFVSEQCQDLPRRIGHGTAALIQAPIEFRPTLFF